MADNQGKNQKTAAANLDVLNKIWKKVGSVKRTDTMISNINQVTRSALNAAVSSLFLFDEKSRELILKSSDGPSEKQLRRFQINNQAGITGWVALNGRPLIANNVESDPRFNRLVDEVYGINTKSVICAPLIVQRKVIGVIKVVNKAGGTNFTDRDLQTLTGITTTAALTLENARLNECLQDAYKSTIKALVSLADAKETTGGGHSKRVTAYSMMAVNQLNLSENEKHTIEYAGILHDIGKLAIPDSILNKAEALSHDEWRIMRAHPETGYNLLKVVPFLSEASKLILYHHERYDGKGYPYGVKGEAIPLGARILAVADAFDNMTTEHAYRAALSKKYAFSELTRYARTQFCPVAVKAFYSGYLKYHLANKKKMLEPVI